MNKVPEFLVLDSKEDLVLNRLSEDKNLEHAMKNIGTQIKQIPSDVLVTKILSKIFVTDWKPCYELKKGPSIQEATNGTTRVWYNDGSRSSNHYISTNQIIWYAAYGSWPKETVSHLCGRRNCPNVQHMVDESLQKNLARIGCPGFIVEKENPIRCIMVCPHTPFCARVVIVEPKNILEIN